MTSEKSDFGTAFRALLKEHPEAEKLKTLSTGEITSSEACWVREHLERCSSCRQQLVALKGALRQEDSEVRTENRRTLEEDWEDFRTQIPEWSTATGNLRPTSGEVEAIAPFQQTRRIQPRGLFQAAVAALALVSVGLGIWVAVLTGKQHRLRKKLVESSSVQIAEARRLSQELKPLKVSHQDLEDEATASRLRIDQLERDLEEAFRPKLNTPVIDLSSSALRGSAPPPLQTVRLAKANPLFTLILDPEKRPASSFYALRIKDREGHIVLEKAGLIPTRFGNFVVTLARSTLPEAVYRLQILGGTSGSQELLGDYRLRIEDPASEEGL